MDDRDTFAQLMIKILKIIVVAILAWKVLQTDYGILLIIFAGMIWAVEKIVKLGDE